MNVLKQRSFALTRVLLVMMLVAVSLASLPALADDLAPPPWRLSSPSSTWQHWKFSNPPVWPPGGPPPGAEYPENYTNPNGLPQENVAARVNAVWHNQLAGRQGVWELWPSADPAQQGYMEWFIPNFGLRMPKIARIQFTLSTQNLNWVGGPVNVGPITQLETDQQTGITWWHNWAEYRFPTCDPFTVWIKNTSDRYPLLVDQLVVDTVCVPEPGTMLLSTIGFGVVGAALRRRRKV